jgi:hypothetical protein
MCLSLQSKVPDRSNTQVYGLQLTLGNQRKTHMQWQYSIMPSRSVQWQRPCENGDHQPGKSAETTVTTTCFFRNNGGQPTCVTFCTHMSGVCTPLTTVCYVIFNSWKERRKSTENLGWFCTFHLPLPFTYYFTHTHTELSQLMSACSIFHIAIQSTHQTVRSFGWLPLREQGVHSCNFLLLDAKNMNELQVKFVPPATILNAIFNKAVPLQAWTGPQDSRRFKAPRFLDIGTWRW